MGKTILMCLLVLIVDVVFADDFLDRFSRVEVKLTPNMTLHDSGHLAYYLFADALPNGDTVIGWNHEKTAYVKTVDQRGADKSIPFTLDGFFIGDLRTFGTDKLHMLAFEITKRGTQTLNDAFHTDLSLYYFQLDLGGKILVKTHLLGGSGASTGGYWHIFEGRKGASLQFNGDSFAIYAGASHDFGRGGVHQGEFYTVLDKFGNKKTDKDSYFKVSHSWGSISATLGKDFYSFTSGDAIPFGLVGIDRSKDELKILWPQNKTSSELSEMKDTNYWVIGAGEVVQAENVGSDRIALLTSTSEKLPLQTRDGYHKSQDPQIQNLLLMYLDNNLSIEKQKWITNENKSVKSSLFFVTTDGVVVIYSTDEKNANPSVLLLDNEMNQLAKRQTANLLEVNENVLPFRYQGGDIGWVTSLKYGETAILNRYKPKNATTTPYEAISVAGTWATSFNGDLSNIYSLNLAQNGTKATGTYNLKDGKMSGNILKTGDSTWLIGTWTQTNSSGWFKFEFKNGSNFTGTWGYGNSGKTEGQWNGTKLR